MHREEDEGFYLLEGRLRLYVGRRTFLLEPGQSALAPRGVPHTWRVESDGPARWLNVAGPAFERFCLAADRASGHNMSEVAHEHGIEILGPPGTLPDGWVPGGAGAG